VKIKLFDCVLLRRTDRLSVSMMASFSEDAVLSRKQQCVEPLCRDSNTTSQMWQGTSSSSYSTPESAIPNRCAATRRLDYSAVQPTPFLLFHAPAAAISTEPSSASNSSASGNRQSATLTSSKVVEGRQDVLRSFQFSAEQVDCICDVLRQSNDVERLGDFLGRLTPDQLERDSEPLYKVDRTYSQLFIDDIYDKDIMYVRTREHPESTNLGQSADLNFVEVILYAEVTSGSPISIGFPYLVKIRPT